MEGILEEIQEKTGRQRQDILGEIEKKKQKFSGMITDSGACFLLAKELGINMDMGERLSEKREISSLEPGMRNIDTEATVSAVFQEKPTAKGEMQSALLSDATGQIRLTLWNKEAGEFREKNIGKGDRIEARNCIVKEYMGKPQLGLGHSGTINLIEKGKSSEKKFSKLKEEESSVDIIARAARVFEPKKFAKNSREGKVLNFELFDGKDTMMAVAWNDAVERVKGLEPNDLVKIENAYTKKGLRGTELHIGYSARIIKNPETESEIPEAREFKIERKGLGEIMEGDRFEQRALVSAVIWGKGYFEVCPKCGKKPSEINGKAVCENCGQLEEKEKRLVLTIELDDGFARRNATLFGEQAEKIAGNAGEAVEAIEQKGLEGYFEELAKKTVGKEIVLQGRAKKNRVTGKDEIIADRIRDPDFRKEAEMLAGLKTRPKSHV